MTAIISITLQGTTVTRTLTVGPTYDHAEMQIECAAGKLAADAVTETRVAAKEAKCSAIRTN